MRVLRRISVENRPTCTLISYAWWIQLGIIVDVDDGRWRENINSHIMKTKRAYLERRRRRCRRRRRNRPRTDGKNHWTVARTANRKLNPPHPNSRIRSWNILGASARRSQRPVIYKLMPMSVAAEPGGRNAESVRLLFMRRDRSQFCTRSDMRGVMGEASASRP